MTIRDEIQGMVDLNRAVLAMPKFWVAWMGVLTLVNLIGGLVFIQRHEGWVTVVVFLVSAMFISSLFKKLGYVKLMGIGHILWVPLVIWFWMRLEMAPEGGWLRIWMTTVIVCNTLSLIIDTVDVVRYFRGERQPTITLQ